MGLLDIFISKEKKVINLYRNYKTKPFGVGLKINNLSDADILWIDNNIKENFNFSDFPREIKIKLQPIPDTVFFAMTTELLEIYNANSKEIYQSILGNFLENYLNKGVNGIVSQLSPSALWILNT